LITAKRLAYQKLQEIIPGKTRMAFVIIPSPIKLVMEYTYFCLIFFILNFAGLPSRGVF
jgi:hypothetical protein